MQSYMSETLEQRIDLLELVNDIFCIIFYWEVVRCPLCMFFSKTGILL